MKVSGFRLHRLHHLTVASLAAAIGLANSPLAAQAPAPASPTATAPAEAALTPGKRPDPARFEKELAKFDAEFKEKPVKGGIVFTGSSSIRLWKTATAFPKLAILNRGFGGSVANDLVVHADRVVLRYEPKVLVVYTGSNDLNAKLKPEEVLADYTAFLNLVHEKLPDCRVIVNSVKVSESRLKQIPAVNQLNSLLQAWCEGKSWVRWLESMNYLMDDKGVPKNEYFRKDKLHLNDAGYAKWNAIIGPVIKEEWAKAGGKD
ncbi:GDSL-type esterase/lipase family protein [Verrucomicrobium sp. BvORR106]|uniref:GDSL-type esterase/lipase family protein n=1 Tax=Verrucomicrobium sp. BvORR106 TaxID=1403819 RepID=UPI00068A13FB|nr:GDSL-type esterase/lipase family protein [Verrucomicrobium sp. BvORR106]